MSAGATAAAGLLCDCTNSGRKSCFGTSWPPGATRLWIRCRACAGEPMNTQCRKILQPSLRAASMRRRTLAPAGVAYTACVRPLSSASCRRRNASRAACQGGSDAVPRAISSASMTSNPPKPLMRVRVGFPQPLARRQHGGSALPLAPASRSQMESNSGRLITRSPCFVRAM